MKQMACNTVAPLERADSFTGRRRLRRQSGHLAKLNIPDDYTRNVRQISREETIEEGKMLFGYFITEEFSRATDLEAPKEVQDELDIWTPVGCKNPQWAKAGRELRKYADDFMKSKERQKVKSKAREMSTAEGVTKEQFSDFLSSLLEDGITRETILVLFFFCSDIAIATLRQNNQSSATLCCQLLEWSFQFIAERVCSWVQEHGGWGAVFNSSLQKIGKAALVVGFALVCYFGVKRLMK